MSTSPTLFNALCFRVLFARAGAGSGSGSGSGSKTSDTRTSGCRRRLPGVSEFASAFATSETTFVAVASVLSKSPSLATIGLGPDPDARPAA